MKNLKFLLSVLPLTFAVACGESTVDSALDGETGGLDLERLEAAASAPRAAEFCAPSDCGGAYIPGDACQCDDACVQYGDCCANYNQMCGPGAGEGEVCGGIAGIQCADGLNCIPDSCETYPDQAGTCAVASDFCTQEYAPVCGCDGQTYTNLCNANGAGVAVAYQGECNAAPGACESDDDCVDSWCGYDAEGGRICKPFAELGDTCGGKVTPENVAQCGPGLVCWGPGLAVDIPGECVQQCGGIQGLTCDDANDYCLYDACGSDMFGRCADTPQFCTEQYEPVCGCDGQTYGNECKAAQAGATVASAGACETGPSCEGACGGQSTDGCWCDSACAYYGDCCDDKTAVCG